MPRGSDLVVVGDVHIEADDPLLPSFLHLLREIGEGAGRLLLMGDLFDLWIGDPRLEGAHHRQVLEALRALRRRGVETHYLEGNRDFNVGNAHAGDAFDAVSDRGLDESWGGRRIWASHGDLVNTRDRQYRAWRRLARSRLGWAAFSSMPAGARSRLAARLERSMRGTNLERKRELPAAELAAYGAARVREGFGLVLLGHFHTERTIEVDGVGRPGELLILPLWRDARRHLRIGADGAARFEGAPV